MGLVSKESMIEKLGKFHPDYMFNITSIKNFIKEEPEVDAVERKNGRWKGRGFGDYECTICWGIVSGKTRYCPHCGADMRG